MGSIVVAIEKQDVPAFKELLETHDLVDVVREEGPITTRGAPVYHFTLDAGLGNSINYFYLGGAWASILEKQKGGRSSG
ncbi:hypothetical protein GO988_11335 [Hymenobacter sp. HMF4947]|uniref:Uncharacterized protein n=1 Tax=Hymenobacter ginkgonis TaxID=2682976 RepID=A0A7K1TET1_9BACT|nr:hypothetical protein [Hymenobacter ginkgonis]MVN76917.1 hypothetical protein [Hymenobacter ginkgonis]